MHLKKKRSQLGFAEFLLILAFCLTRTGSVTESIRSQIDHQIRSGFNNYTINTLP